MREFPHQRHSDGCVFKQEVRCSCAEIYAGDRGQGHNLKLPSDKHRLFWHLRQRPDSRSLPRRCVVRQSGRGQGRGNLRKAFGRRRAGGGV